MNQFADFENRNSKNHPITRAVTSDEGRVTATKHRQSLKMEGRAAGRGGVRHETVRNGAAGSGSCGPPGRNLGKSCERPECL